MKRYAALARLAIIATACVPWLTSAQINKCVGSDGKVAFSDQPCSSGQATTQIKEPNKPASQNNKAMPAIGAPSDGLSKPNTNVQVYDTLCAEDQRLFDRDARKLSVEDRGLREARLNKRCNPQARLAAAEKDKESLVYECRSRREELKSIKNQKLPPGYADRSREIVIQEAWLKANCN